MATYLTAHHQGLIDGDYWTSTVSNTDYAYKAHISGDGNSIDATQKDHKTEELNVRAVLAF